MVKRLLIVILPCFIAAGILSFVVWQRFEPEQLNQVIEVAEQVPQLDSILGVETSTARVKRVIDGDTIELESGEKVRYIGIDTPETQHPTLGQECFGSEATARNRQLVEGKEVRLEVDRSQTDRYQRLLRYVWIEDELINRTLVAEGYAVAHAYPPDTKYQTQFELAELEARTNDIGLWGVCSVESP